MNIYDSYSHMHCMKVAMLAKLKRCLPMIFSHFKHPHCCSVHGCQLFLLILAKRNAFYAKCFQKYQIISVHQKQCKPRTVGPDLQRILRFLLRLSEVPPEFLLSQ